jgi:hypothetical protein
MFKRALEFFDEETAEKGSYSYSKMKFFDYTGMSRYKKRGKGLSLNSQT